MDGLLAAQDATHQLDGAIADDFVDVHVGLGARARLPDDQREVVVVERAVDDLVAGLADGVSHFGVETVVAVDLGGCLLQDAECFDHRQLLCPVQTKMWCH